MGKLYFVNCLALNARSEPKVKKNNIVTVLHQNDRVVVSDNYDQKIWPWVEVFLLTTKSDRRKISTAFVHSAYLSESEIQIPEIKPLSNALPEAHLATNKNITLNQNWGRAYPLTDMHNVTRDHNLIIKMLDVENSLRYKPTKTNTFCNVYASGFCNIAGIYLPRVWWNQQAVTKLIAGEAVQPIYGKTVREMSANSLFDWLSTYGQEYFGWRRIENIDEFQYLVNCKLFGVISAKNKNPKKPGHISICISEDDEYKAGIDKNGKTVKPLQSQAGARNKARFADSWFLSKQFSAWGMWVHE